MCQVLMARNRLPVLLLVSAVLAWDRRCLAQQAEPTPATVQNAEQLVQEWDPGQHLYVKGDLGIGQRQLSQLESWLRENGPHWTVALFRSAAGEVYRTLDQRRFDGMDAVEYALGRGLALRTSFSELLHPQTQETDGTVFVLFLDERKFSYYGSVAQDVRSLGESHWVGELDRPAFRAMRGGGRILDAVKDTVTHINGRLSQKIQSELQQQQRDRDARQRALANLLSDMMAARQSVDQAEQAAASLKDQFPTATGKLASPPIQKWRNELDELQVELTAQTVRSLTGPFHKVSHEIEGYLNAYAQAQTLDDTVQPLEQRIEAIRRHALPVGRPMADEAADSIEQARSARSNGKSGIADLISQASDALDRGENAIQAEQARLVQAEARRKLIRTTVLATAALLSLVFAGVLAWLNRRRVPAKKRAVETFAEREAAVKEEMDKVYGLFERSGEILGSKEKVRKRGYEGETKKLTDHTFEDVDDLIVMSAEVERVMDEAREMIHPKQTTGKIANMFSGSRYERGVNRISGEPLKFHRDKGLPLVIRRESEMTGEQPPEEISMTFDKVFEAFHDRTSTAEDTLGTIENSLLEVDERLKKLQENIEQATSIDRELAELADADGMLQLPAFFEKLLPSAQADFDQADAIAATDPVQAIQVQIPGGTRKIAESLAVASDVQRLRNEIFPQLNQHAPTLKQLDYNTEWMQQHVDQLGERANALIANAVEHSVADGAQQFASAVAGLGQRAAEAVQLAKELRQDAIPSLSELEANVEQARQEIAGALHLPVEKCLAEYEANPSGHLGHARELLAAAQAALQHGGVEAATEARDALIGEVETANSLVEESLRILHQFDETMRQRENQLDDVREKVPRHEQLLSDSRARFAESALIFQAADASFADPSANVSTHLQACREALDDASRSLSDAATTRSEGRLLEAARLLSAAEGDAMEAGQLLADIDQHCSKLNEVSLENAGKLAEMQRQAGALESRINDRRTMQPTIREYQRVLSEIEVAQREIQHTLPRDPFRDAAAIEGFTHTVANLDAQIEADLDAHAEAKRAVEGAKAQLRTAQDLVSRARNDGIPDSPATLHGVSAIRAFEQPVRNVQQRLDGAHDDWKAVDQEAVRINSDLGVESAKLRGELERASRSVHAFEAASNAVFEATRWTGGFGTRIFGSPGSSELERARRALQQGDYGVMVELARAAQIAAQHAIQRAQREVYRKQREQARREEEARRRRRRASIQIGGGGGGFPSPGRSSGGGVSRSSSPSGSGFSRSGW